MVTDQDFSRSEITDITFTNGSQVEHGDYWLINTPDPNYYFYVWYDNPTWISPGDPNLQGRIGIRVVFNYSDTNIEIATNTMDSILAATSLFEITQSNDILSLTCTLKGESHDAEHVTSPFSFDISQQGHDLYLGTKRAASDERVYIVYGIEGDISNDEVRTSATGEYSFTGLTKGHYKIYVYSKDTINGGSMVITKEVDIEENKSIVNVDDFEIFY